MMLMLSGPPASRTHPEAWAQPLRTAGRCQRLEVFWLDRIGEAIAASKRSPGTARYTSPPEQTGSFQALGYDMTVGGLSRILSGHLSLVDQLVDHAVVFCQASEQFLAVEVDPRVTGVSHKDKATPTSAKANGACSRSLPRYPFRKPRGIAANRIECFEYLVSSAFPVPRMVGNQVLQGRCSLLENFDTQCRGSVTTETSSDSISNDVDAVMDQRERCLIVLSFSTRIGHS